MNNVTTLNKVGIKIANWNYCEKHKLDWMLYG